MKKMSCGIRFFHEKEQSSDTAFPNCKAYSSNIKRGAIICIEKCKALYHSLLAAVR